MAGMDCYAYLTKTEVRPTHEYHLNQVNKLSRTFVALLHALNRHRGKTGQQKVTVEHVRVPRRTGNCRARRAPRGWGACQNERVNPMRQWLRDAKRCGAKTRRGSACQGMAMPNGRCRMHGGTSPGAPKGNRNAWKHGYYSEESILLRRAIRALLGSARDAVDLR
jgi:hypothetical protein